MEVCLGKGRGRGWAGVPFRREIVLLGESVQFSCSVGSHSLRPGGLQHTGFPVHHQRPEEGDFRY